MYEELSKKWLKWNFYIQMQMDYTQNIGVQPEIFATF